MIGTFDTTISAELQGIMIMHKHLFDHGQINALRTAIDAAHEREDADTPRTRTVCRGYRSGGDAVVQVFAGTER